MNGDLGAGTPETFDVAILGAGSGGENLAGQLAQRSLRVAVVEERLVGGECPFFACMPSKAMLHHALAGRTHAEAVAHRDRITDHRDDDAHANDLTDKGVVLVRGTGRFDGPGRVLVATDDGDLRLEATHLVLATGAGFPRLDVPGADEVGVWNSEDAWTSDELPERAVIVGAGPVGTELATAWTAFGAQVVLVERDDHVLGAEDREVAQVAADRLASRGVDIRTGTEVVRLEADGTTARVHLSDGTTVEVDRVVACLGKVPRSSDVGLGSLGVDPDDLEVGTDGRVAGAPDVWAIGDVSGHPPFTHAANAMADVIAHNLTRPDAEPRHLDLASLPRATFVDPPVASVGTTTPDDDHVRVTLDLADTARGSADAVDRGLAVLAATRADRRVVGFAATGPAMDEVVSIVALAIRQGLTVDDLADLVVPFPTHGDVVAVLASRARDELDG